MIGSSISAKFEMSSLFTFNANHLFKDSSSSVIYEVALVYVLEFEDDSLYDKS